MANPRSVVRYRIQNWRAYNRALINRGRLTVWFDEQAIIAWRNTAPAAGPGAPRVYADLAIECALVFKSVYHLSLRAAQGFLSSVVELMQLTLPIPGYSTVSRRQGVLAVRSTVTPQRSPRHVVIDATGLKVYGAGESRVYKHRVSRRRTWGKLHLGVDERTKEIVAVELTGSRVHDSQPLPALLEQIPDPIDQNIKRRSTTMAIRLNHTIVAARDKEQAAKSLTEILGLSAPVLVGPFAVVRVSDDTSLDYHDTEDEITSQHYAFLVDENEFDQIFARIRDRHLTYWADPYRHKRDEINTWDGGRGIYFDDPNGHLLEVITRPYGSGGTTTSRPHPLFAQTQSSEDHESSRSDPQGNNGGGSLATAERPDVRGVTGR